MQHRFSGMDILCLSIVPLRTFSKYTLTLRIGLKESIAVFDRY
jgi:hypothetical protein